MLANIANAVTAVGIIFVVLQLRGAQIQRHRGFEDLFNQRYWTIMDGFSSGFYRARDESTEAEVAAVNERDADRIHAYLALSEDQADMRRVGWVTDDTWEIWRDGIATSLRRAPIAQIWADLQRRQPDEFRQLRALDDGGRDWDPIELSPLRRWLRGL